jgi:CBS domain-containing protein
MVAISEKVERKAVLLDENKTTYEAAVLMSEKHIGSVVITRNSQAVGLFTERDLIHRVIHERRNPENVKVKEVMRTKVPMVTPDESCENCIELMKQHMCRHLLVFDQDAFVGIISLRDLLALLLEEKEELIHQLTKYVTT